jgi:hypothetical protein
MLVIQSLEFFNCLITWNTLPEFLAVARRHLGWYDEPMDKHASGGDPIAKTVLK